MGKTFYFIYAILLTLAGSHVVFAKERIRHETCELFWTDLSAASSDNILDPRIQNILESKGYIVRQSGETYPNEKDLREDVPAIHEEGRLWAHKTGPSGGCWDKDAMFFGRNHYCTYDLQIFKMGKNTDGNKSLGRLLYLNEEFDSPRDFEETLEKKARELPSCSIM